MLRRKNLFRSLTATLCLLAVCILFAFSPAYAAPSNELYLGGFPAGFMLNTKTVEVVGLCDVMGPDGAVSPAKQSGIEAGDIIESVNGIDVDSASRLNDLINEQFKSFELVITRGGQKKTVTVQPVKESGSGKYKLGLLVRDSLNGIGTVTYIDKSAEKFGSLGHAVADMSGTPIEINGGALYDCSIYSVKKGLRGNPGELKGMFNNTVKLGEVRLNCSSGIFGDVTGIDYSKFTKIETGRLSDVKIGAATVYTTIDGNAPSQYDISIVKVDDGNKDNKNFVIKIEDKELLDKSGGIVQGMSGSPIVQDGKLIGAVTHVFINDPTRGYGIAIENMQSKY